MHTLQCIRFANEKRYRCCFENEIVSRVYHRQGPLQGGVTLMQNNRCCLKAGREKSFQRMQAKSCEFGRTFFPHCDRDSKEGASLKDTWYNNFCWRQNIVFTRNKANVMFRELNEGTTHLEMIEQQTDLTKKVAWQSRNFMIGVTSFRRTLFVVIYAKVFEMTAFAPSLRSYCWLAAEHLTKDWSILFRARLQFSSLPGCRGFVLGDEFEWHCESEKCMNWLAMICYGLRKKWEEDISELS